MIANIHQSISSTLCNVREKKVAMPSTYKERVTADRIVMGLMFLGTIVTAVITA